MAGELDFYDVVHVSIYFTCTVHIHDIIHYTHVSVAQKEGTLQEVLMFHIDRTDRMHPNRVWYADVYSIQMYAVYAI